MLHFLICVFLISAQPTNPAQTDIEVIREQGSLLNIKFVPGKPIKFFIVGREEAEIDLSKTKWKADVDFSNLSVSLKQTNPNPGKVLKIKRFENHYIVDDPLQLNHGTELQVDIDHKDKTHHTFKVKVKGTH
ncbi:hypothetical protein K2X05_12220 [bacterium]|nr:hypothetical protein [bacterium]